MRERYLPIVVFAALIFAIQGATHFTGTAYHLTQLVAGVAFAGNGKFDRPFDPTHIVNYSMGGAYGARGQWRVLRGQVLSAARDGKRIKDALERSLALDPALLDAYFGIGLYHYYAAVAPTAAKMLRWLLLLPGGDRATGLREMVEPMVREHAPDAPLTLLDGRSHEALAACDVTLIASGEHRKVTTGAMSSAVIRRWIALRPRSSSR